MELVVDLPNRRATRKLAAALAPRLEPGDLVVLAGALGAGKTFFVRALCRELGVPREQRVASPTFALVHEYEGRLAIRHADLYRVESARELAELGLDVARDEGAVLLVEWGAPYVLELGGDALVMTLSLEPRRAQLSATGPRGAALLAALAEGVERLDSGARAG
ncbi:MAG TPA: tRNA (adenosine(37)-N6)-threonylcarbamoyltransferase complex ATPase subunit type 1 TsaE [Polyangiaceae bacterium]|nr:tRNA (adenosine(37)-N6)-threonylcarbamoyltransferase complex ATPase subunit type 1 TsaE [Polyangiaceae bacterium]